MTLVSSLELKKKLNSEDKPLLIDVREPWEYDEENIGAKNLPLSEIPNALNELNEYKNQEIIVHCKTGKRSNQAMKYLSQNGFSNVKSLEGGIEAYLNS